MIDWFLLERYFADKATPAERGEVERWVAERPDRPDTVQRIRAALEARGRGQRRDWRQAEAVETVLARVREGSAGQVIAVFPRRPLSESGSAAARLAQLLRSWFEGATELAAAMLLDANEQPMSDAEVQALRDRINDRERQQP